MTEALQPALVPFVNRHNRQMTFMRDNAPGYRARATRGWLAALNPIRDRGGSVDPPPLYVFVNNFVENWNFLMKPLCKFRKFAHVINFT